MSLSPEQRTACAELLSRATAINCFEEAALLLDTIESLVAGEQIRAVDVIRWLTLLPRVKDRAAALAQAPMPNPAQLALVTPVSDLPDTMQHAMRPVSGADRRRSAEWLTNPDAGPSSVKRIGRPATADCTVCGETFQMNPFGRPATRCEAHRRTTNPRHQESA